MMPIGNPEPMSGKRIPGHVERVGLFGGTFDPVHLGHLILAMAAMEELALDRVIFIPAGISPHKSSTPPVAPAADRLEMLRLATHEEYSFSIDDRELRREGPSYTIDTVELLMEENPGVRFIYLIGGDHIPVLQSWHRIDELRNLVDFAVLNRGNDTGQAGIAYPMVQRRIDISSTEIRERLAKGLPVSYYLPTSVHDIIVTRGLYIPDDQD